MYLSNNVESHFILEYETYLNFINNYVIFIVLMRVDVFAEGRLTLSVYYTLYSLTHFHFASLLGKKLSDRNESPIYKMLGIQ